MTEQEKATLVEIATKRLAQYRKMQEYQNSDVRPRGGIDFKYEPSIALMEIALAALTADPVGDFYEDGKDNWWQLGPHDKVPHVTPLYANPPAPAQHWIPCSDRVPEPLDWVIAHDEVGTVKAYICKHSNEWVRDNGDNLHAVTHWMPLPVAPEVNE